ERYTIVFRSLIATSSRKLMSLFILKLLNHPKGIRNPVARYPAPNTNDWSLSIASWLFWRLRLSVRARRYSALAVTLFLNRASNPSRGLNCSKIEICWNWNLGNKYAFTSRSDGKPLVSPYRINEL